MSSARAMRRLSDRLIRNLSQPTGDEDVIALIGQALTQVRGRTVRLRKAAFPPATASGLWVDRPSHDLIVYEENTDPEHQIVIIGHEAWHMFHGHCSSGPIGRAASRAAGNDVAVGLAELVAVVSAADDADAPFTDRTDAALHYAARSDTHEVDEELDAEHFGLRFATDLLTALRQKRSSIDPHHVSGRIGTSMAHHFRQI
ncbi:toxin-antitoxin system, toxin component [Streptomyces sp. NPDC090077]|uniref:toxin-antitoxin system, toxin component n=1 Tax=Streptomyces sp. NPDC090077 TaxID=3365938 RepID=UPI00382BD83A